MRNGKDQGKGLGSRVPEEYAGETSETCLKKAKRRGDGGVLKRNSGKW